MKLPVEQIVLKKEQRYQLSSTSKGNQTKWFFGNRYYKADTMGYEGLAELAAWNFSRQIEDFHSIPYYLCKIKEAGSEHAYMGCYSESFLEKQESLFSIAHILELLYLDYGKYLKDGFKNSFRFVCNVVGENTGLDISEYLAQNLYFDALILNEDRHLNNLAVIRGEHGFRIAPIFDHGLALLSDLGDYGMEEDFSSCIKRVKAKPFSAKFEKQVKGLNELGLAPLKINKDGAFCCLDEIKIPEYPEDYMVRCRAVIKRNLRKLEGYAWIG